MIKFCLLSILFNSDEFYFYNNLPRLFPESIQLLRQWVQALGNLGLESKKLILVQFDPPIHNCKNKCIT